MKSVLLITGPGRCGLASITRLLNEQDDCHCAIGEPPWLPWNPKNENPLRERVKRLSKGAYQFNAEANAYFLPHIDALLTSDIGKQCQVIYLSRNDDSLVRSLEYVADHYGPVPVDNWSCSPGHPVDPLVVNCYPKTEATSRNDALRRFAEMHRRLAETMAKKYPTQFRICEMEHALSNERFQREVLELCGFCSPSVNTNIHENSTRRTTFPKQFQFPADNPRNCAILVPNTGAIPLPVERGLRALEKKGYPVRRLAGFAAIDQARNVLATEALIDGFAETFWIDSDVEFDPLDVDRIRSLNLPLCSGIYPKKGTCALASHLNADTKQIQFGEGGSTIEIRYAATGFLHVRRKVYEQIMTQQELPVCNEAFGQPVIPFFQPMVITEADGQWYLAEDFSFSHRARLCGFKVFADTRVRLWHMGQYRYGWEDAGCEISRLDSLELKVERNV